MPDAGVLRQQIEQMRVPAVPVTGLQPLLGKPTIAPARPDAGPAVQVTRFSVAGNTLLSDQQLQQALAAYQQRSLTLAELQSAADAVAGAYRDAGWLARVYVPEQDASAGVLVLQAVEAHFGGLKFEGKAPQRVTREEVEAYVQAHQVPGQPLRTGQLDRALLLVNDLPGVSISGLLVPGESDGETALVISPQDGVFLHGDMSLDNSGARSTGRQRLSANLNLNSLSGRGDLLSLSLLKTEGSDYSRLAVTIPAGHKGLRLGLSASSMQYQATVATNLNTTVKVEGSSSSAGFDLNYPFLRSSLLNLYGSAGWDNKRFFTRDTQVRSDYGSDSLRLSLSGSQVDGLAAGGVSSATVQWLSGELKRMQSHSQLDSLGRNYHKLTYSFSRLQALAAEHAVFASLSGQRAMQELDSSEKFYVGGPTSVRAYPVSELGGEQGQILTGEWRWRPQPGLLATVFVDLGRVKPLATTPDSDSAALNLRGRGLSLNWQSVMGHQLRLTWAHRNGAHPKPTSAQRDSDGTLEKNRLWLSASLPY